MPLPESTVRLPLSVPKEYLRKDCIKLDAEVARTRGLRTGDVVREHVTTEELARKVSCMSAELVADIIKETDEECERLNS